MKSCLKLCLLEAVEYRWKIIKLYFYSKYFQFSKGNIWIWNITNFSPRWQVVQSLLRFLVLVSTNYFQTYPWTVDTRMLRNTHYLLFVKDSYSFQYFRCTCLDLLFSGLYIFVPTHLTLISICKIAAIPNILVGRTEYQLFSIIQRPICYH